MTPEQLREGLIQSLEGGGEGFTLQDLEERTRAGLARFWLGERGALVTYIVDNDEGRSIHVWLGCGDIKELVQMRIGIEAFARAHGCQWATINSRKGWSRVFANAGFEPDGEQLRKRL
jgi:hypothetical protein